MRQQSRTGSLNSPPPSPGCPPHPIIHPQQSMSSNANRNQPTRSEAAPTLLDIQPTSPAAANATDSKEYAAAVGLRGAATASSPLAVDRMAGRGTPPPRDRLKMRALVKSAAPQSVPAKPGFVTIG